MEAEKNADEASADALQRRPTAEASKQQRPHRRFDVSQWWGNQPQQPPRLQPARQQVLSIKSQSVPRMGIPM